MNHGNELIYILFSPLSCAPTTDTLWWLTPTKMASATSFWRSRRWLSLRRRYSGHVGWSNSNTSTDHKGLSKWFGLTHPLRRQRNPADISSSSSHRAAHPRSAAAQERSFLHMLFHSSLSWINFRDTNGSLVYSRGWMTALRFHQPVITFQTCCKRLEVEAACADA